MNILHEINGKKYVLVADYVSTATGLTECQERIKKYNCIFQRMELLNTGFWGDKSTNVFILVPEESIEKFNSEIISLD